MIEQKCIFVVRVMVFISFVNFKENEVEVKKTIVGILLSSDFVFFELVDCLSR